MKLPRANWLSIAAANVIAVTFRRIRRAAGVFSVPTTHGRNTHGYVLAAAAYYLTFIGVRRESVQLHRMFTDYCLQTVL